MSLSAYPFSQRYRSGRPSTHSSQVYMFFRLPFCKPFKGFTKFSFNFLLLFLQQVKVSFRSSFQNKPNNDRGRSVLGANDLPCSQEAPYADPKIYKVPRFRCLRVELAASLIQDATKFGPVSYIFFMPFFLHHILPRATVRSPISDSKNRSSIASHTSGETDSAASLHATMSSIARRYCT